MLTSGLWRTTTFRLSMLFGAMFAVGMVLLLGLIYFQTAGYLTLRMDHIIKGEAESLRQSGQDNIQRRVQSEGARDPLGSFGLFAASGARIAGETRIGLADLPADGQPREIPAGFQGAPARALAQRLPWGDTLIVARDARQLVELRKIIVSALVWSGALIAILGLISGAALSLRPLRRIRAMQAASDTISSGDFSRRLPLDGSGDELDELARITNRMMDEAERLMLQARTVGEGAAHELRTPMTRLRAMLDHASEAIDPDDPARRLLDQCVSETDGVLARFRALLRIAALEARGRHLGVEIVLLAPLMAQIIELYEPLAAERDIRLETQVAHDAWVRADSELLVEAVSNLIDNAVKFTPVGGRVRLRVSPRSTGAVLEVEDSGPGIAEAERALVTKRFYRSQRDANVQGYGLGLSVVAAIAELHGFGLSFDDAHPGAIVRLSCLGRPR